MSAAEEAVFSEWSEKAQQCGHTNNTCTVITAAGNLTELSPDEELQAVDGC